MVIVLDTNVLVAATLSPLGASFQILTLVPQRRFELLLSVPLMLEYEEVLKREDMRARSHLTLEDVDVLLDMLAAVGTPQTPFFQWRPQLPDPDDEMVLELAANGRADAIVTRVPGLGIGVSTADCGPVLLADAHAHVVGAAHAGWRGALAGVIEACIAAMERIGADRARIVAALGPMIRQPNYEVGADVVDRFLAEDRSTARFFATSPRSGHSLFDLAGLIADRLQHAGVSQVEDLGLCTYADAGRFFSYRRATHRAEADYGRHVNGIALAD